MKRPRHCSGAAMDATCYVMKACNNQPTGAATKIDYDCSVFTLVCDCTHVKGQKLTLNKEQIYYLLSVTSVKCRAFKVCKD